MQLSSATTLSVIVPLGAHDQSWRSLCSSLLFLPEGSEVLFVRPHPPCMDEDGSLALLKKKYRVQWIVGEAGRAQQMNLGARYARQRFLWFLHADSVFLPAAISCLLQSLEKAPAALHFFDLAYLPDGPVLSTLNGKMANVRSRALGIPFGDQGFCLSQDIFWQLGAYDPSCPYGEDHVLIWKARLSGIPLRPVGAVLRTSARKYKKHGWLKTSADHFFKTWKQALPFFIAEQKQKLERYFER
ncbi:MAG: glycosyltransferase [Deltaproteobacteria bacterium]|nr:glycosyltransferase [Deltaproteobacteria bacterium]